MGRVLIQTEEFKAWFATLSEAAQDAVATHIIVLEREGPNLGRPRVDSVKGSAHSNMKELRTQFQGVPLRSFFAFDPERRAVLLIGGKKQGEKRFYKTMIPLADALFSEYLEAMKMKE